jgi:hypothetical protein
MGSRQADERASAGAAQSGPVAVRIAPLNFSASKPGLERKVPGVVTVGAHRIVSAAPPVHAQLRRVHEVGARPRRRQGLRRRTTSREVDDRVGEGAVEHRDLGDHHQHPLGFQQARDHVRRAGPRVNVEVGRRPAGAQIDRALQQAEMRARRRFVRVRVRSPPQAVQPERIERAKERLATMRARCQRQPRQRREILVLDSLHVGQRGTRAPVGRRVDERVVRRIDADLGGLSHLSRVLVHCAVVNGAGVAMARDQLVAPAFYRNNLFVPARIHD